MSKLNKLFILLILLLVLVLTGCSETESYHTIYLEEAFSITPYVSVYETDSTFNKHSFDIKNKCNEILQSLDDKFNVNKEDSMISNVNNNASNDYVEIDEEFYNILKAAIDKSINVCDKYDPTIYALSLAWDFKNQYYKNGNIGIIPSDEIINEAKELVDYNSISLTNLNGKYGIKFEKIGMKIDLGSIVKGYAADYVESILKDLDVNIGIINIGGNIITFGDKEIKVGITTPFNEKYNQDCNIIGTLNVKNESYTFVTTGIYERYIKTSDSKMYHHILDKETGYPVDNDLYSVTIVSKKTGLKSMEADSLSTAIYILGLDKGLEYCNKNNIDAIFITKDKDIVITNGINDLFTFNIGLGIYGYKVLNNE